MLNPNTAKLLFNWGVPPETVEAVLDIQAAQEGEPSPSQTKIAAEIGIMEEEVGKQRLLRF